MPADLPDRIRDAGAQPTRPFDLDRSLRRRRRRRAAEGLTFSGMAVAVVIAVTVNLPLGGRTPERPLVEGDGGPPACTDAARLPDLASAADVGDDVVLFAACATERNDTDLLTGPYVALGRGTAREQATAAQLAELYVDGLTTGELGAGYSLAATDLPAGALTATRDADVVIVNVTAEVLERPNATTTYLADAFLEQVGALFLQLPGVERVAFELEGSCQDFATTLERVPCLTITQAGIESTEVADDPDLHPLTDLERSLISTLENLNVPAVRAELPGPESASVYSGAVTHHWEVSTARPDALQVARGDALDVPGSTVSAWNFPGDGILFDCQGWTYIVRGSPPGFATPLAFVSALIEELECDQ